MAYAPFDLTGKAALITGGNRGIGLAMADALAQAGSDVVIWGSNLEANLAAEDQLNLHGVRVLAQRVDVTDERAVDAAMLEAVEAMGRLDTVIANAGAGASSALEDFPTEAYRHVMAVNLDGVFFTFRAAGRHMIARAKAGDPGGSLIATASTAAVHGAARNAAYGAAKGAVVSLVRATAVEYARHGIRANAVLPGWVATKMTEGLQASDVFNQKAIARVPSRRWGRPEEFGGIAVYLASDASSFHTGDAIVIDGAYTIA
jgi:NAD(P)-dependent dehydrogenase (short-subunit alcohol dehydrogenase family)